MLQKKGFPCHEFGCIPFFVRVGVHALYSEQKDNKRSFWVWPTSWFMCFHFSCKSTLQNTCLNKTTSQSTLSVTATKTVENELDNLLKHKLELVRLPSTPKREVKIEHVSSAPSHHHHHHHHHDQVLMLTPWQPLVPMAPLAVFGQNSPKFQRPRLQIVPTVTLVFPTHHGEKKSLELQGQHAMRRLWAKRSFWCKNSDDSPFL